MSVTPPCDDGVMAEHQFDHQLDPQGLDYSGFVGRAAVPHDRVARRAARSLVREQRRLHVEELAVVRVLDERGRVDDSLAATDGVSVRSVRETVATARALGGPARDRGGAAAGGLSSDQLTQVVKVADPSDDHRWAAEAAAWSPADLAHQARLKKKPTVEDAAARRAARELRFWWRRDHGMLDGRFSLPDIDGAVFESVLDELIEQMRPAKGQPWATREHRGADALVELCRAYADRDANDRNTPTSGNRAHLVVQVPLTGPATVAGIPLPDPMVEALRADAKIEPVLVDADGAPVAVGRVESVLSEKDKRVVKQRDGKCR